MGSSKETFLVIRPGLLSTIQDRGRFGSQWMGFPASGALDDFSFRAGNRLLAQGEDSACLEITMLGPKLKILEDVSVVLTGADFFPEVNGRRVPMWTVLDLCKDDLLSMTRARQGCRSYLCVEGGFDVPLVMGSRSTNVRLGLGGFQGRPLKKGDLLLVSPPPGRKTNSGGNALDKRRIPVYTSEVELRVVMGPHDCYFPVEGLKTFLHSEYRVSLDSNREGMRLTGPPVTFRDGKPQSIPSEASPPGGIQIRPNGEPLILMNDLSGGGYARIGHIISSDLSKTAQLAPGGIIRFKAIDVSKAHKIASIYRDRLEGLFEEVNS